MNDQEQHLQRAFERVCDEAPPAAPDWSDVLARAGAIVPARSRVRPRPRLLLAGVAALFAAILALPQIGLGSKLVDLVQRDPPSAVRTEFAFMDQIRDGKSQGVIASRSRQVLATTQYGRATSLWVAPTRSGGACYLVRQRKSSAGGCLTRARYAYGLNVSLLGLGGPAPPRNTTGVLGSPPGPSPFAALLSGRAAGAARTVRLVYQDGTHATVPFRQGWFLFAVPLPHLVAGHRPVSLEALDANGTVLHRETKLFAPHVPLKREGSVKGSSRTLQKATVDGKSIGLIGARSVKGNRCIAVVVDGKGLRFPGIQCGRNVGRPVTHERGPTGITRHSLIHWDPSFGGDPPTALPLAAGWAAAPIARLRIRYADGSSQPLALHGRLFLYVVPAGHRTGPATPLRIEGLDAHGTVVQSLRIDRRRCARGVVWKCPFPG